MGVLIESGKRQQVPEDLPKKTYVQVGIVNDKAPEHCLVILLTLKRIQSVESFHSNFRTGKMYCYKVSCVHVYAYPKHVMFSRV